MARPTRQSGRPRKANPKYINGDWDERALAILRESGSPVPGDEGLDDGSDLQDDESDAEFDAFDIIPDNTVPGTSTLAIGQASNTQRVTSPDHEFSEGEEDEDEELDDDLDMGSELDSIAADRETPTRSNRILKDENTIHVRGVQEVSWKLGKTRQYPAAYGQTIEDLEDVLRARDTWLLLGRDVTLPSRATMSQIAGIELEKRTTNGSQNDLRASSTTSQFQQIEEIDFNTLRFTNYLPDGPDQKLVLGPWKRERLYNLPYHHVLGFNQAWRLGSNRQPFASEEQTRVTPSTVMNGIDPNVQSIEDTASVASQPASHEGWLINVGERMQALAWAPQFSEDEQYLAVACRSTTLQYESISTSNQKMAPGLSASAAYPSSIRLWRFASKRIRNSPIATPDMAKPPALCMVLACSFGGIRDLKWAPQTAPEAVSTYLGDIAILSTDGCVHLLRVPAPDCSRSNPTTIVVKKAAVTLEPPANLIFTAFAFASSTDIIVGSSDGTVHLFSTATCSDARAEPYLIVQVHVSYVLALAPAGTGELSHFMASCSATGDIVLTDLRAPTQDRLHVQKTRLPTKNLVYSPHTRSWITTVDHSGVSSALKGSETKVIAHSLRQFYAGHQLSRFAQGMGSATVLAGSTKHPFVLAGNSQGTILSQNVARRMLPAAANIRTKPWVHKLFQYDWTPQSQGSDAVGGQSNGQTSAESGMSPTTTTEKASEDIQQRLVEARLFHGKDTRPGISRFHEGFKPERQDFSASAGFQAARPKRKKGKSKSATVLGIVDDDEDGVRTEDVGSEVIFEEEQAVTAIAWNENIECATWAAMGWGSGVLRVQDLSHDADPR